MRPIKVSTAAGSALGLIAGSGSVIAMSVSVSVTSRGNATTTGPGRPLRAI